MTEYEIERLPNGIRKRHDGNGDAWANQHRLSLNNWNYMTDIDMFAGLSVFAHNSTDRLFVEYGIGKRKPQHQNNVKEFVIASLIDRKRSIDWATDPRNKIQTELYSHLCRVIGTMQPEPPDFFVVIGGQSPPWAVYRVDIETATISEQPEQIITRENDFKQVWVALGILGKWARLNKWIYNKMTTARI